MSQNAMADTRAERWRETMRYRRRLLQGRRTRLYREAAQHVQDTGTIHGRTSRKIKKIEQEIREFNALAEELGMPTIRDREAPQAPGQPSATAQGIQAARKANPFVDAKFSTYQCQGSGKVACGYRTPSAIQMGEHLARTGHESGINGDGAVVMATRYGTRLKKA